jgi:hypothetical protein
VGGESFRRGRVAVEGESFRRRRDFPMSSAKGFASHGPARATTHSLARAVDPTGMFRMFITLLFLREDD